MELQVCPMGQYDRSTFLLIVMPIYCFVIFILSQRLASSSSFVMFVYNHHLHSDLYHVIYIVFNLQTLGNTLLAAVV